MSGLNYSSEPVLGAAKEQDCYLGLLIRIFSDLYELRTGVVFPHSCI